MQSTGNNRGTRSSHLAICPGNGQRAQDSGGAGIERSLQGAEIETPSLNSNGYGNEYDISGSWWIAHQSDCGIVS